MNDLAGILAVVREDDKQNALRTTAKVEDEAQCIMDRIQQIYDLGVRRIVLMNTVWVMYVPVIRSRAEPALGYRPLERAPLFSHDTIGDNTTQHGETISKLMVELVSENNGRQEELLPFVRRKLYDADIQLFDTHALFERILAHPEDTYGDLRLRRCRRRAMR